MIKACSTVHSHHDEDDYDDDDDVDDADDDDDDGTNLMVIVLFFYAKLLLLDPPGTSRALSARLLGPGKAIPRGVEGFSSFLISPWTTIQDDI